ncbi:MAG: hypothetical protein JW876_06155, partial [Candidatus Krumholzibacteriota bacterium]|nr:hypothetical protein [Candidatus Krumholzibacteriota bacterium]
MAIAPMDYTGDVLAPGEAIVVDGGYGGPDEIWIWSPVTSEGEILIHADDGTLVEAVDIAVGPSTIHLVDVCETDPGAIYSVGAGGVLTLLATSQPLADPCGITYDPVNGDLLVLDMGDGRLVRIDPATGEVSDVLTGVAVSSQGWAGVDITADGRQLVVSAFDGDAVYVFARCDAAGHPELDCDDNGIYDACDIASGAPDCNLNGVPDDCDIESGASDDCNLDGIPDDCPDCPPVEVIFIMDTSASMDDEASILCGRMDQVITTLEAADLDVVPLLLGVCDLPGGIYGCLQDHIVNLLGTIVPGSPPPGLEILGACTGVNEGCSEDWALATAVVAGLYPWQPHGESIRLIIPLSDEGPWCGDPVTEYDEAAIEHAISVAQTADVIVSPITGTGATSTVKNLAQALADSTGGIHFNSTEPALDITESIVGLVLNACASFTDCNGNGTLDECDISSGASEDLNGNGVPDECEAATGADPYTPRIGAPRLAQNSPNPFNPSTTIAFELPRDARIELVVFALDGRRVATLARGRFVAGRHEVAWDGRNDAGRHVAAGVYFYRLEADGCREAKRMVLVR